MIPNTLLHILPYKFAWTNATLSANGYSFSDGGPVYADGKSKEIKPDKSKRCVVYEVSRGKYKATGCSKWRYINTVCREKGKDGESMENLVRQQRILGIRFIFGLRGFYLVSMIHKAQRILKKSMEIKNTLNSFVVSLKIQPI